MFLASPAIALEGDELSEGATEILDGTVDHHENQEREGEDYRDDRKPILDGRQATPLLSLALVYILEPVFDVRPRVVVSLVFRHACL